MPYVVLQLGYAIFGAGETEDEALNDAVEWIDGADTPSDINLPNSPVHGDFVVRRATPALVKRVISDGAVNYSETMDGVVCLPEEV